METNNQLNNGIEEAPAEWLAKLMEDAKGLGVYEDNDFPKFMQYWERDYQKGKDPMSALLDWIDYMASNS